MKEDWAEKLRQKLEGHQKTPPPGLWEDICKEMGLEAEPVQRKPVIRRWYWVAAATVLALVGFFVFYNSNDVEQPQLADAVSQQPVSEKLTPEKPVSETLVSETSVTRDSGIAMNQTANPSDFHADESEQSPSDVEEEKSQENVQTENEPHESIALRAENADTRTGSELKGVQGNHHSPLSTLHSHPSSHPDKWSIGVNASGGLLAANTSQRMGRLYYSNYNMVQVNELGFSDKSDGKDSYEAYSLIQGYTLTEYVSEHHLPVRFGLSLNYQLSPRLALLSGISYTYLYSEFKIPLYSNISYDQKLHYLGIPLGLSYQLWSSNRFQFYLSGGVMLEKCLNEKPWQWSVDASAGVEYALTRQFGFFLEPSLGYYFKDGTSFEHYYKEHPLTPSIEFGLRLHLSQ